MKENWFKTPISRLRAIGFIEGISFLVLLVIAMPLKYFAGIPQAVKLVGWLHGLLFILYIIALLQATIALRWSFIKLFVGFIASLIPLGTFLLDSRLRQEEQATARK